MGRHVRKWEACKEKLSMQGKGGIWGGMQRMEWKNGRHAKKRNECIEGRHAKNGEAYRERGGMQRKVVHARKGGHMGRHAKNGMEEWEACKEKEGMHKGGGIQRTGRHTENGEAYDEWGDMQRNGRHAKKSLACKEIWACKERGHTKNGEACKEIGGI